MNEEDNYGVVYYREKFQLHPPNCYLQPRVISYGHTNNKISLEEGSLFKMCLKFIALNISLLDSLIDFPEIIGKQLFNCRAKLNKRKFFQNIPFKSGTKADFDNIRTLKLFGDAYGSLLLTSISLTNVGTSCVSLGLLLSSFQHVKEMDLSNMGLPDDILVSFSQFLSLEKLVLHNTALGDDDIKKLTLPFRMYKDRSIKISHLDFSGNRDISSNSIEFLLIFKNLKHLNLSSTNVQMSFSRVYDLKQLGWTIHRQAVFTEKVFNKGWASEVVLEIVESAKHSRVEKSKGNASRFYQSKKSVVKEETCMQDEHICILMRETIREQLRHLSPGCNFLFENGHTEKILPDFGTKWFDKPSPKHSPGPPVGKPFLPDKRSPYKVYDADVSLNPFNAEKPPASHDVNAKTRSSEVEDPRLSQTINGDTYYGLKSPNDRSKLKEAALSYDQTDLHVGNAKGLPLIANEPPPVEHFEEETHVVEQPLQHSASISHHFNQHFDDELHLDEPGKSKHNIHSDVTEHEISGPDLQGLDGPDLNEDNDRTANLIDHIKATDGSSLRELSEVNFKATSDKYQRDDETHRREDESMMSNLSTQRSEQTSDFSPSLKQSEAVSKLVENIKDEDKPPVVHMSEEELKNNMDKHLHDSPGIPELDAIDSENEALHLGAHFGDYFPQVLEDEHGVHPSVHHLHKQQKSHRYLPPHGGAMSEIISAESEGRKHSHSKKDSSHRHFTIDTDTGEIVKEFNASSKANDAKESQTRNHPPKSTKGLAYLLFRKKGIKSATTSIIEKPNQNQKHQRNHDSPPHSRHILRQQPIHFPHGFSGIHRHHQTHGDNEEEDHEGRESSYEQLDEESLKILDKHEQGDSMHFNHENYDPYPPNWDEEITKTGDMQSFHKTRHDGGDENKNHEAIISDVPDIIGNHHHIDSTNVMPELEDSHEGDDEEENVSLSHHGDEEHNEADHTHHHKKHHDEHQKRGEHRERLDYDGEGGLGVKTVHPDFASERYDSDIDTAMGSHHHGVHSLQNHGMSFHAPDTSDDHTHEDETFANNGLEEEEDESDNGNSKKKTTKSSHKKKLKYPHEPTIVKQHELVEPSFMLHEDPHGDGLGNGLVAGLELGGGNIVNPKESAKREKSSNYTAVDLSSLEHHEELKNEKEKTEEFTKQSQDRPNLLLPGKIKARITNLPNKINIGNSQDEVNLEIDSNVIENMIKSSLIGLSKEKQTQDTYGDANSNSHKSDDAKDVQNKSVKLNKGTADETTSQTQEPMKGVVSNKVRDDEKIKEKNAYTPKLKDEEPETFTEDTKATHNKDVKGEQRISNIERNRAEFNSQSNDVSKIKNSEENERYSFSHTGVDFTDAQEELKKATSAKEKLVKVNNEQLNKSTSNLVKTTERHRLKEPSSREGLSFSTKNAAVETNLPSMQSANVVNDAQVTENFNLKRPDYASENESAINENNHSSSRATSREEGDSDPLTEHNMVNNVNDVTSGTKSPSVKHKLLSKIEEHLNGFEIDDLNAIHDQLKQLHAQKMQEKFQEINEGRKKSDSAHLDLDVKSTKYDIPDHQLTLPITNPGHPDDSNGTPNGRSNSDIIHSSPLLNPSPTSPPVRPSRDNLELQNVAKGVTRDIDSKYQKMRVKTERGLTKNIISKHPISHIVKITGSESDLDLQPFVVASKTKALFKLLHGYKDVNSVARSKMRKPKPVRPVFTKKPDINNRYIHKNLKAYERVDQVSDLGDTPEEYFPRHTLHRRNIKKASTSRPILVTSRRSFIPPNKSNNNLTKHRELLLDEYNAKQYFIKELVENIDKAKHRKRVLSVKRSLG